MQYNIHLALQSDARLILYVLGRTSAFLASTSTDRLILTLGQRDVLLLDRAAKSPADHRTAPPENPPTLLPSSISTFSPPYTGTLFSLLYPQVVIAGPPCFPPDSSSWCSPRSLLVGRYRHLPPPRFHSYLLSHRVLERSHSLRGLILNSSKTHSTLYQAQAVVGSIS